MMVDCRFAHERAEEVGGGLVHKLLFCDARGRYIHRMECRNCDQNQNQNQNRSQSGACVDRARTNLESGNHSIHTDVKSPHKSVMLDYPRCLDTAEQWFDREVLKKEVKNEGKD
jgi:hypothetical protein